MPMQVLMRQLWAAWKLPRWRWALITAIVSDGVGIALITAPPAFWALDAVTVVLLFVLLGFRWPLLPALVAEAVPGLQVFPAWTLVVIGLAATHKDVIPLKVTSFQREPLSNSQQPSRSKEPPCLPRL